MKRLYNLRSNIVHGTSPTQKEIESELFKISSTLRSEEAGVKRRLALDRGRDLLRRAILTRAFLTQIGKWPPGNKGRNLDVDGELVEPTSQEAWREAWHSALGGIGLGFAAAEATPAELFVALPDRVTQNAEIPPESGSGSFSEVEDS